MHPTPAMILAALQSNGQIRPMINTGRCPLVGRLGHFDSPPLLGIMKRQVSTRFRDNAE
jgi:hypothetical protein